MKIATSAQMRAIDRRTIREYGIPGRVLMERAALSVAQKIKELYGPRKTIVLAGGGNNGGDGLAVARILHNEGWHIRVHLLAGEGRTSPDCRLQLKAAAKFGVPVVKKHPGPADLHAALVVDAIFGSGLNRDVADDIARTISLVNRADVPVVAVDVPSGISRDTGTVMGAAIRANHTVTFGLPGPGHFLHPGAEHAGVLHVENIGFPEGLLAGPDLKLELPVRRDMALLVPERPAYSHKKSFGHVLAVCGSAGKTGAALLCSRAVLGAGAGLVTLGVPEDLMGVFQTAVMDEMTLALPSKDGVLLSAALEPIVDFASSRADVLAIGPGLGVSAETQSLLPGLVALCATPMVIDADGLNCLAGHLRAFERARAPVVLTPHPGEMSRLSGTSVTDIEKDRIGSALSLSAQTGTCVVLKGVPTIVASPEGRAFINPTGTPAMAKAGAGDVLTGMIAAFIAQGVAPLEASVLAVYVHGLAGEAAAAEKGVHSVNASDLHGFIPHALKSLNA